MLRGRKIGTGIDLLDKHNACVALAKDKRCRPALPVGIFLLNAFNTKTGRCDWSISRIARELDMTERTVHRAINKLRECGWLSWKRHGGKHLTNAYSFNWTALKAARSNLSPAAQDESEGETKRVPTPDKSVTPPLTNLSETPDSGVTQNLKETFKETLNKPTNQKEARQKQEGRRKTEDTRQSSQRELPVLSVVGGANTSTISTKVKRTRKFDTPGSTDVWKHKDCERWRADFTEHFQDTDNYGTALEALTPELQDAATAAEMKRAGGGLDFILVQLASNGKVALCL